MSLITQHNPVKKYDLEQKLSSPFYTLALIVTYTSLLFRDAAGGAFRYYTDIYGVGSAWYLPDVFAALYFLLLLQTVLHKRNLATILPLAFLFISSLIGVLTTKSALSVLSAIKMLLPLLIGFYAAKQRDIPLKNRTIHGFILAFSIAGVLWNNTAQLPWTNYVAVNEFGVSRIAANQRWIAGVDRLAGFASDSTAAGYTIMLCVIFLMNTLPLRAALAIAAISIYPIYLTTSRTAGVALFFYVLSFLLYKARATRILKLLFLGICILFVLLPFVLPIVGGVLSYEDIPSWAASMMDRIKSTWVNPFAYIWDHFLFAFITGMGLGSVAFPVKFSDQLSRAFNCADNFMLANYLMFGVAGVWTTIVLLKQAYKNLPPANIAILITFLAYGFAIQGYGVSTYALIVGFLLGGNELQKQKKPTPKLMNGPTAREGSSK
ncbi:MAG: hypothetical protein AB7E52_03175 [Bdellovibrionales bacterium]